MESDSPEVHTGGIVGSDNGRQRRVLTKERDRDTETCVTRETDLKGKWGWVSERVRAPTGRRRNVHRTDGPVDVGTETLDGETMTVWKCIWSCRLTTP